MSNQFNLPENDSRDAILSDIKVFSGQIRAAWPTATLLVARCLRHYQANSHDASLVGKLYNDMVGADHRTIASAVKLAAFEIGAIKFRKDENKDGRYIAFKSDKDFADLKDGGKAAMTKLLSGDGLRQFKPVKKKGETSKASRVHGFTETIDAAIAELQDRPEFEQFVDDVRARLAVIFNDVQTAMAKAGFTATTVMFRKLEKAKADQQKAAMAEQFGPSTGTNG